MNNASSPTRVIILSVLLTAVVAASGVVGFALGRSNRASRNEASAAYTHARALAYASAEQVAFAAGHGAGIKQGLARGEREGKISGQRAGTQEGHIAASRRAAPARLESAARGEKGSTRQPRCSGYVYGICEPYGPAATGHPCPPGSAPNADGGVVCVPNSVVEEARKHETPSTNGTPSVNSPEGQRIIKENPECQAHPPPPGYEGPVQC
jgi:hypothetical protein